MSVSQPLLEVKELTKTFTVKSSVGLRSVKSAVQAVSSVSFSIAKGETLGLVGESGSGKTTVGRCLLRLIEPTSGSVRFEGQEIVGLDRSRLRELRRQMQIVFQDPQASLDPRLTVGSAIAELTSASPSCSSSSASPPTMPAGSLTSSPEVSARESASPGRSP
ncbi:MAG: peptide/nickel transport system ATP-binding protein [Acidimicrobiaceae bacterium]|nr:MAG: peptide/nickel transport system ATP-binding protein [Acidimicrobiaceae bacterium]